MEKSQSIKNLITDIDDGKILLPEFQRDFVWDMEKSYDLFDSLIRDIFIGAIIYGIPSFEIAVRPIDNRSRVTKGKKRREIEVKIMAKEEIAEIHRINKDNLRLILDGQQRMTSLYRSVKGTDEIWFIAKSDYQQEDINNKTTLDCLLDKFDNKEDTDNEEDKMAIRISDVWEILQKGLDDDEIKENYFYKTEYYKNKSLSPDFNEKVEFKKFNFLKKQLITFFEREKLLSYYLLDMSLDKFVIFFERSNTRGVQLNFIDILAAKLYTGKFNLKKKIGEFETNYKAYNLIPEIIVRNIAFIKSIANKGSISIDRSFILNDLSAIDFIENWDILCLYYKKSIDFLYENHFIISQDWMPYSNILIPIMMFLKELGGDFHSMNQKQKDFFSFWYHNSCFSSRYSGSTNERIIEDSLILIGIAKGGKIASSTFFNKLTKTQILSKDDLYSFNKKGSVIYKSIFNLINYHSKGLVNWANDSKLSLNSDLEDHHIFPKAYLEKNLTNEISKDWINCVANRTLVPKKQNIKFSDKKPSEYLNEMKLLNPNIEQTLDNHLITRDLLNGDYDKNFEIFLEFRTEEIMGLVQKYVIAPINAIRNTFYEDIRPDNSSSIEIFARYKGQEIKASFAPMTCTIFYKGKSYEKPSTAASVAKQDLGANPDTTENGWTFWKFKNENGEEKSINEFRNKE